MATDDPSASEPRDRRRSLIIALAIVVALLAFLGGYLLGRRPSEAAASTPPTPTLGPSPTAASPTPSAAETPSPSPTGTASEPGGDDVPEDTLFVQLADLQGGEDGPPVVDYDLAYFYTGEQASQEAAAQGMDPPEAGYLIVNDNPRLRHAGLADGFSVKYLPEGSGLSSPVKAHQAQFLGWLAGSVQTDFPSTDASWWWITLENGEITTIKQQYLP